MPGDGEIAPDNHPEDMEETWLRDVFYMSIDHVLQGLTERFSEARCIFEAFSCLSPTCFASLAESYPTANLLQQKITPFCELYGIDPYRCANELQSFASVFHKFKIVSTYEKTQENLGDDFDSDEFEAGNENDEDDNVRREPHPTFIDCLKLLTNDTYRLVDAYPSLCRAYGIAVAIPATSCTAERSFSTLKRVKTRLRQSMCQERLEGLLIMSIERRELLRVDKDNLIDILGKSSKELENALL